MANLFYTCITWLHLSIDYLLWATYLYLQILGARDADT